MLASLLLFIAISVRGGADAAPIAIPPLTIEAPRGDDWKMTRRNEFSVVFKRILSDGSSDAVAYVSSFYVHSPDTPSAFLVEIKRNMKQLVPPSAKIVSVEYEPTGERGYSCVKARVKIDVDSPTDSAGLMQHMRLLLCRLPGEERLGFAIGFTYPAPTPTPTDEAEADAFMQGVQVDRR